MRHGGKPRALSSSGVEKTIAAYVNCAQRAEQAGYDGVLAVGRVQTPTLKLGVDRDREIAAFKSVPFWAIDVFSASLATLSNRLALLSFVSVGTSKTAAL